MGGRVYPDAFGEIVISFSRNEALRNAVRRIPSAHFDFHEQRGWLAWPSASVIRSVLSLADQYRLAVHPAFRLPADELVARFESSRYAASYALEPESHFKSPLPGLTPFQVAGVQYALKAMRCFIADEDEQDRMAIALGAVQAANAFPAWIVCPANRSQAWHRALEQYLPGKKLPTYKDAAVDASADLVLINYETLDAADAVIQHLNRRPYGLILDEAHYVKSWDAQRTRRSLALAQGIHYRLLLTPTPILNGPVELISPLNVMGRLDEFGGRSGFFQRYCLGQENGAARLDELGRLLRTRCLLRRPMLELETMPRRYHRVRIDNRDDYNAMEVAASKDNDWVGWHTAPRLELAWGKFDAAIDWIRAFLKDKQEKLVVFAYHREIVGDIAGAFQSPWITGETTKRKRAKAIERFTSDPACRLIVISIRADSRGWSLAPARQALFVELGFTPADQQRTEGLLVQPAQAHYLVATNTLEECFFDRIGDKQYVIRTVLDTEPNFK
jgi:SWI/SNF-related matrix-associated actin-dependent regulator 1 of chromatin subfamily A